MEQQVVLIIGVEEYALGTVQEILSKRTNAALVQAVQGVVEDMVFSEDASDYTVCSIEVR